MFCIRLLAAAVLVVSLPAAGQAQITISLPGGPLYAPGPDYASDVLQDPWDFSNAEDISPDPDQVLGWSYPAAAAIRTAGTGPAFVNTAQSPGRFAGIPSADNHVFLLNRPDGVAINGGRSGARFPIDTSRYRKAAVKMRVRGAPAPSQVVAYWFHSAFGETNWLNRGGGAILNPAVPAQDSEQVYVLDLSQASTIYPVCGGGGACTGVPAPYTQEGLLRAFRLDPVGDSAGSVEIDWVRLTASNNQPSAATMLVDVNGCAQLQSLIVTDASGVATAITDFAGGPATASFNYGIFPPGPYNVRASCSNGASGVAAFHINAPPAVTVIDPDEIGDPSKDYAQIARGGDRWDMEQATDVALAFNVTTACAGCGIITAQPPGTGNMLRAITTGALGDPGLELLNGALAPLNSRRHRNLTFSLNNLRAYELSAAVGPVLRLFWGSMASGDGNSMTTSQDMRVWPGFHKYTVDLGALRLDNGGIEPGAVNTAWLTRAIRHLRLDPHEYGDVPTAFDIDDVTLTPPDEVAVGQTYAIRYRFADPDWDGSSTFTARIYRESWPSRTGRVAIATIPGVTPNQALTHTFTANVAAGEYAIAVQIDESRGSASTSSTAYATGPLVVYNPAASVPRLSVSYPAPAQNVPQVFTIQGCAFDEGSQAGINMDDIAINAIAGPGIIGQAEGRVLPLGFGSPRGTIEFGPLGTSVVCSSVSNPGSPYRNAGFRFVDVGLETGPWTLRVYARSTISGEMTQLGDIPIVVGDVVPAPVNFQASAAGHTVTVSWEPAPTSVSYYQIQGSTNAAFSSLAFSLNLGAAGTYSGDLASGTYYLRVYARTTAGRWSLPTPTRAVNVALPTPPGAPSLVATQISANPVSLAWAAGPGGTPTSYTLYAGTTSGASNLAVAGMGLGTSITAFAPVGVPIYVRVVATNAAGSAVSNEVAFALTPPAPPTLLPATVSGGNVTLRWTPPTAGSPPSSYTIVARYPGSPAVIATLPVTGATVTVPAPPGTYGVTMVSNNGQGTSAESNEIVVVVTP